MLIKTRTYIALSELDSAEESLKEVTKYVTRTQNERSSLAAAAALLESELALARGDLFEAAQHAQKPIAIYLALFGELHVATQMARVQYARVRSFGNDIEEAKSMLQEAEGNLTKIFGEIHEKPAMARFEHARLLHRKGEYVEANKLFTAAKIAFNGLFGEEHVMVVKCLAGEASCQVAIGEISKALSHLQEAIDIVDMLELSAHNAVATDVALLYSIAHCRRGSYVECQRNSEALEGLLSERHRLVDRGSMLLRTRIVLFEVVLLLHGPRRDIDDFLSLPIDAFPAALRGSLRRLACLAHIASDDIASAVAEWKLMIDLSIKELGLQHPDTQGLLCEAFEFCSRLRLVRHAIEIQSQCLTTSSLHPFSRFLYNCGRARMLEFEVASSVCVSDSVVCVYRGLVSCRRSAVVRTGASSRGEFSHLSNVPVER